MAEIFRYENTVFSNNVTTKNIDTTPIIIIYYIVQKRFNKN